MTAETSQTLDRGLKVLKLLADTDHGLTVTELAAELGVNRTVVYRLLATLEQHSLVRRDLGGRARVGLGVLGLAHQVHPLLREAALPALRSLAEDIGATAHLTLVDGGEALAVAVVEPTWTDYHVAYRTGFRHPLDRGAAGRAILAGRRMQPAADGNGWEGCTDGYAEDGANGADGADGASSANGASGADGASSANGASGAGDVSSANGANGANSADGASSANGADSASSVNGVNGVHSVHRAYSSHSGYSKPGAGHFTAPADGTDRTIGPGGATNEIRYVLTHGELEAGASGAAAPLLGVPGIEGSVGVVMLAASVPERVGLRVAEAATEVADALR